MGPGSFRVVCGDHGGRRCSDHRRAALRGQPTSVASRARPNALDRAGRMTTRATVVRPARTDRRSAALPSLETLARSVAAREPAETNKVNAPIDKVKVTLL